MRKHTNAIFSFNLVQQNFNQLFLVKFKFMNRLWDIKFLGGFCNTKFR